MEPLEFVGVIAFSVSGAIRGIEKGMDVLGVMIVGLITAVGGGMIRDLILGVIPPKVFCNSTQAMVALLVGLITFIIFYAKKRQTTKRKYRWSEVIFTLSDAIGLGAFTVVGIQVAYDQDIESSLFLLVFVGVITGVGGGILRDIMCAEIPSIFVKHIYAAASIMGALICVVCHGFLKGQWPMIVGTISVVLVRVIASRQKLNLPRVISYQETRQQNGD